MSILIYLVTAVFIICSLLLTLVVLVQKPRSEGLGSAFGGGMTDSLFGAQTTDALTKITIWLAGFFFACTLGLAILYAHRKPAQSFSEELSKVPAPLEQTAPASPATPEPAQ
ncbi:MAG: preprotein translocase subunit SecG [Blastochloris sp.]|nr:preprotein translocase subunit SecG [Blastochloris sp.]